MADGIDNCACSVHADLTGISFLYPEGDRRDWLPILYPFAIYRFVNQAPVDFNPLLRFNLQVACHQGGGPFSAGDVLSRKSRLGCG